MLFVASLGDVLTAVMTSVAATLCFNYFFLPPVGTFTIADPHNWVALFAFLVVSIVASRLSTAARAKAQEALERRNELTRLFDLSRDILLTTERDGALPRLPVMWHAGLSSTRSRFASRLPRLAGGSNTAVRYRHRWFHPTSIAAFASAAGSLEFDARTRSVRRSSREIPSATGTIVARADPHRIRARLALLAIGGRLLEPGTSDAVAGIVAIALERSQFLEERRGAELSRQRAELSSALLASLSHDLRTPLTAIRTAVSNLDSETLPEDQRRDQARVALGQLDRLTRLFDEILDMARIDAGSVQPRREWTAPAEIVEAAIAHAAPALAGRDVRDRCRLTRWPRRSIRALPRPHSRTCSRTRRATRRMARLTCAAGPTTRDCGSRFATRVRACGDQEIERLFEPFYRGEQWRSRCPAPAWAWPSRAGCRGRRRAGLGAERHATRRAVHHRRARPHQGHGVGGDS